MQSTPTATQSLLFAICFAAAAVAVAGPDDDARFQSDGTTRNSVDPIVGGGLLADTPTNTEASTGLRIMPPTGTQLIAGQRFDLRVETQIPAQTAPVLKSLRVNNRDITSRFVTKINAQGLGLESGTPTSNLLYGATARNLDFATPGVYTVEAVVSVAGNDLRIANTYSVSVAPPANSRARHVVFFLGDAMGLPVRTAARIYSKGIFEGRARGRLNLDTMQQYGLVMTASFDSVITDSAPGMANYITGMKQANNALNVAVDNTPENPLDNPRIETLFEFLKRVHGWRIGVLTDAFVTDATPAAAGTHTRARSARTAIAQQMIDYYADGTAQPATGYRALAELTQPFDVILGSGAVDWLPRPPTGSATQLSTFYQYSPTRGRTDGSNLFDIATQRNYSIARNADELNAASNNQPLLGIFTGEFRATSSGLGTDNVPGVLDRLVARGQAKIGGRGADDPALGMTTAPPQGTDCGATVRDCFAAVPSKVEMVQKAVAVLNTLAGRDGNWALLIEQSQSDKLAHPLEYERTIYEVIELDNALGYVLNNVANDRRSLVLATADHAQPESIIGVALPGAITAGGATPPGGCFSGSAYPITLGSTGNSPCPLQDVIGTFNDGTFPTYIDADADNFPDDPDPTVKLVIDDGGRPTYAQDYLTNPQPLNPSGATAALPNPARDPNGLLLTGNMPTRNVIGGANKTNGNTSIAPHSGDDVPLSASGVGASLFGGVMENTDVHVRIAAALSGPGRAGSAPAGNANGNALRGL